MKWRGDERSVGVPSGFDGFHSTTAPRPKLRPAAPEPAAAAPDPRRRRGAPGLHGRPLYAVGKRQTGRHRCDNDTHTRTWHVHSEGTTA